MIQPIGYFRIWRELYTKPIWLKSTLEQQVILMTLLAMANFQPKEWEWKGEKFSVQSGQFITSLESIRVNTGGNVSIQNIRTALARFEKLEFLTNESTKTGRLITIVNWGDYQHIEGTPNIVANKDLTKTQQRPNKDLTPREEGNKEIREESNNNIYSDFVKDILLKKYPGTKTKSVRDKKLPKILKKYGVEEIERVINRYALTVKNTDKQFILTESTFWNGRYIDFLDENYIDDKGVNNGKGSSSNTREIEEEIDWAARAGIKSF